MNSFWLILIAWNIGINCYHTCPNNVQILTAISNADMAVLSNCRPTLIKFHDFIINDFPSLMSSHIDSLTTWGWGEFHEIRDTAVYKHYNMFPESLYGNNEEIRGRLTEFGRIREKGRRILSLELFKQIMCPFESSS